jgi:hypothetical protein
MARTSANDPKQTSRLVKILVNEDRASTIPAVWRHHKVPRNPLVNGGLFFDQLDW